MPGGDAKITNSVNLGITPSSQNKTSEIPLYGLIEFLDPDGTRCVMEDAE